MSDLRRQESENPSLKTESNQNSKHNGLKYLKGRDTKKHNTQYNTARQKITASRKRCKCNLDKMGEDKRLKIVWNSNTKEKWKGDIEVGTGIQMSSLSRCSMLQSIIITHSKS